MLAHSAYSLRAQPALASQPLLNLARARRADVLGYFDETWTLTEVLFEGLATEEAFFRAPHHGLRHPLIFYFCHPAVFYVNKLRAARLFDHSVDAELEREFAVGVDEMAWDDLARARPWPALAVIRAYRRQVYERVCALIETAPGLDECVGPRSPLWALFMAFEHERIHFETSSVLLRELPIELVRRPARWPALPELPGARRVAATFVAVPEGSVRLGKPADWPSYGWDNEYGEKTVSVPRFSAACTLVTNGEFDDFVAAGGYRRRHYWSDEGWAWRSFRDAAAPPFWPGRGQLRLCFEMVPMQAAWPVIINYHEAAAYCAWRSEVDGVRFRPIAEAEHHRLRGGGSSAGANWSLAFGSEWAVDTGPPSPAGFHDVFGNVWEWCAEPFAPLPGFAPHPLYDDFSAPCFDGQHNLIMGGSFASTGDEATPFARFHFRRHFVQHAGLRLVSQD